MPPSRRVAFSVALPLHAARALPRPALRMPSASPRFTRPRRCRALPLPLPLPLPLHALPPHHAAPQAPQPPPRTAPHASLPASLTNIASTGAGILVLGFIVFIHECGHFLAARAQNIRVANFSIGFGPKLLSVTPSFSDVEFTLRLLPLGGFVSFPEHVRVDEHGKHSVDDDKDLLQNRPLAQRALVISAGVLANLLLAWCALFASTCALGVPTYVAQRGVAIEQIVDAHGAAARAGLQPGDVIVSVDKQPLQSSPQSSAALAEYIRGSQGREMLFGVLRDGNQIELRASAKCCTPDGSALMGVQLNSRFSISRDKQASLARRAHAASAEFWRLLTQTARGLATAARDVRGAAPQLSGPVGVVSMGAQLARDDAAALLTFAALISINLALINALPLPALDGGQMVLLAVEALRGRAVSAALQEAINRTALVLLLAFSGALFVGDLERLQIVQTLQRWWS